ncbi:MAG: methyltransferase [Candidatus Aminicenantes bacterium]|nr:methyltransferase [Candidatus Aminicenantes bacterium]NIM80960.1 methyltransferase [Candidatus Aminicenantes bacterium]NIN20342.1 methyltransferase [Candidatus Aminicenantes bacterium]NIN44117.1 methyltransferase [Candidatus Aminicenantes bacterium]NIN86930.1 methyltransferase [Candidatus Aminicenantes bacterium]
MIRFNDSEITRDYFYKRKVIVYQRENGYRFSVDAPILADFLPSLPGREALEVGTGVGIVALLALYKKKFSRIYGLEIQPGLSELAAINARENGFSQNLLVRTGDFNEIYKDFSGIQHIFSNPPYFETHRGRLSPNLEIRDAKTETKLSLPQLLTHSYSILGKKGSLYLVLPHSRYKQLMDVIPGIGYYVSRLRLIFSFKDGKPERFLIQLTNYNVSLVEMPPLIIFKEKGVYTAEMDKILTG